MRPATSQKLSVVAAGTDNYGKCIAAAARIRRRDDRAVAGRFSLRSPITAAASRIGEGRGTLQK